jgi:DNA segregation ATPase FtsK/SpoIIIE-like protein
MIVPPSKQDAAHIQKSYADVVETFKDQPADKKTLSKIQDALNDNARRIYDKWGRIVAKVGPNNYIDITSPRVSFREGTVKVVFMEVNREGKPIG